MRSPGPLTDSYGYRTNLGAALGHGSPAFSDRARPVMMGDTPSQQDGQLHRVLCRTAASRNPPLVTNRHRLENRSLVVSPKGVATVGAIQDKVSACRLIVGNIASHQP